MNSGRFFCIFRTFNCDISYSARSENDGEKYFYHLSQTQASTPEEQLSS